MDTGALKTILAYLVHRVLGNQGWHLVITKAKAIGNSQAYLWLRKEIYEVAIGDETIRIWESKPGKRIDFQQGDRYNARPSRKIVFVAHKYKHNTGRDMYTQKSFFSLNTS